MLSFGTWLGGRSQLCGQVRGPEQRDPVVCGDVSGGSRSHTERTGSARPWDSGGAFSQGTR